MKISPSLQTLRLLHGLDEPEVKMRKCARCGDADVADEPGRTCHYCLWQLEQERLRPPPPVRPAKRVRVPRTGKFYEDRRRAIARWTELGVPFKVAEEQYSWDICHLVKRLRDVHGLSFSEIARKMGSSHTTTKKWYVRKKWKSRSPIEVHLESIDWFGLDKSVQVHVLVGLMRSGVSWEAPPSLTEWA